MTVPLPDIAEAECTPLVRQLLDIIGHLQNRIQELDDEIRRLKGLKTRPIIAPSPLETPPRPPRDPGQKRPGSAQRLPTARLTITDEVVVPLADPPPGSTFKGYEDCVVQISSSARGSSVTAANAGRPPTAKTWWPDCQPMAGPTATLAFLLHCTLPVLTSVRRLAS